jgi:hypothetical protein
MRFCRGLHIIGLMAPLIILVGCQRTAPPSRAASEPREIGGQDLPELGEYMPPLDGERIEVAPPEGWTVSPRGEGYVVRFRESTAEKYPMILVTAEDCEAVANLSPDNVREFADRTRREESLGAAEPITIGDFVGVVYGKRGKEAKSLNRILERLLLVTVADGRKYTLELRTWEGQLEKSKRALFAVAGGIRFAGSRVAEAESDKAESVKDKSSPPKKAAEQKAAEKKPAEKKPADKPDPDLEGLENLFKDP